MVKRAALDPDYVRRAADRVLWAVKDYYYMEDEEILTAHTTQRNDARRLAIYLMAEFYQLNYADIARALSRGRANIQVQVGRVRALLKQDKFFKKHEECIRHTLYVQEEQDPIKRDGMPIFARDNRGDDAHGI